MWTHRHLLGLEDLTRDDLSAVLDLARTFKKDGKLLVDKRDTLKGKTVLLLFFENSTRTAMSFSAAAKRLSADVVSFSKGASSTAKGETLVDTAKNIEAMGAVDVVVIRHSATGAPHLLARSIRASVVNAGDGAHEHPTQGLLDIFTIRERLGRVEGLRVAIVGDIAHSRVARSNIYGLKKLGAEVTVCGPATLVPDAIRSLGVKVSHDLDAILPKMDVVNMLRIQKERLAGPLLPSDREYTMLFGLTRARAARLKKGALVLHPGPTNRGVEIAPEVADGDRSVILEQVANGVAVRQAVLSLVTGK
jgi:aspartate carbamoyltransferase catalytic subunit